MEKDSQFKGFEPIHTIFYTIFHPTEGSKVCYEFPPNNLQNSNINFDSLKNYIIPKPQLCHRLLTLKYANYRIVSYPVAINNSLYARNYFRFNLVFVFQYDCQTSPYESAIMRLGKMFRSLEEQRQILSRSEHDPALFKNDSNFNCNNNNNIHTNHSNINNSDEKLLSMPDLLMRIYQDLNNYSECLIPINQGHAIDLKIFPLLKTPKAANLSVEDVPMLIVNLAKIIDLNWDPTMISIIPYITGLNSIFTISKLSNCDPGLVIECIKHLIYYKCVIIIDIFQFSNIYAPTSLINTFLTDPTMATECRNYVTLPRDSLLHQLPFKNDKDETGPIKLHKKTQSISSSVKSSLFKTQKNLHDDDESTYSSMIYSNMGKMRSTSTISSSDVGTFRSSSKFDSNGKYICVSKSILFDLYCSLSHNTTLSTWYETNYEIIHSNFIDIRKFIHFGIIKKIIYRIQSYPVMGKRDIIFNQDNRDNDMGWNVHDHENESNNKIKEAQVFLSTSDIKFDMGDKILNSIYKKLSKVSFQKSNTNYNIDKTLNQKNTSNSSTNESLTLNKEERLLLLKSLENIESFDKICTKLGKSRHTIEQILHDIGDYRVVNC
ncbi:nitrogen permease regulating protein NPR2 PWA37_001228 [Arxiozyma heterogenica]